MCTLPRNMARWQKKNGTLEVPFSSKISLLKKALYPYIYWADSYWSMYKMTKFLPVLTILSIYLSGRNLLYCIRCRTFLYTIDSQFLYHSPG